MVAKAAKQVFPRANYQDKEPTALHVNYADWLAAETGCEIDLKSVQLATALRMNYQRSDANQGLLEIRRAESENSVVERQERREAREAASVERVAAAEEKKAAAKVTKAERVAAKVLKDADDAVKATAKAAKADKADKAGPKALASVLPKTGKNVVPPKPSPKAAAEAAKAAAATPKAVPRRRRLATTEV